MATVEAQILQDVTSAASLAVGTAITYLVTKVAPKYIKSKTVQNVVSGLGSIAESVVQDFNQRVVGDLKANNLFTAQAAAQVKADAVAAVKSQGAELVKLADGSIGDVDALISSLIEKAVVSSKK